MNVCSWDHVYLPYLRGASRNGGLDRGDVYLVHRYHGLERARGNRGVATADRLDQYARRNLPVHAAAILAPPAALSAPPLPTIAFQ